jgi:diguanylate cyclase (GGDEF)-like protein
VLRHALAICLVALVTGFISGAGALKPLKDMLTELRFSASSRSPTGGIVLVEIDAKSIAQLGAWPWPRRVHADLIRAIDRLDPSEIAMDIDFSSASNETDDSALEAALRDARSSVILAAFTQRSTSNLQDGGTIANRPLERFRERSWLASVNIEPDSDGRVRRYPFGTVIDGEIMPSVAALYGGVSSATASFLVDFSIAAHEIDRISVVDLLQGHVEPQRLKEKKIIVGASAIELRDFFQVPKHGLISGSLLQAISAETILQGRVLWETGLGTTAAGLAVMALLIFAARRFKWHIVFLGLVIAAVVVEALAFALQAWRPIALDTSAWHVAFVGFMVLTTSREIDLRRFLLSVARTEKLNALTVLDQVVSDSFDGIVVVDDEGNIQSVSRSAARILQPHNRRNWKGRPVKELAPRELTEAMRNAIAASSQGTWRGETLREICLPNIGAGERVLEYIVTPSRLRGGPRADGDALADRFIACLSFRDITDRRLAEKRLEHLAQYDTLTNLPNRNHFMERLSALLEKSGTDRGSCAVLYFDLDRFKNVNDTFGHATGDLLLQAVARRSLELLPSPHMLARFGGDEFAALWMGPATTADLEFLTKNLIEHLSDPYKINGNRLAIGVSIGIMMVGDAVRDAATIMKNADTALYRAKKAGGGSHCFYDASMDVALLARQKLEVELWDALVRQEFTVLYQPQFDLTGRRFIGVEALLRWRHPERGIVPPDEFIPVAEEIGLMESLGDWVLHQACKDAARWPRPIKLAVNVSPVQFTRGNIVRTVESALAGSGLAAQQLELEITETLFIQKDASIHAAMDKLKALGISFALDDFGTGYSSLGYLRTFPVDTIKIDRSFVTGVPDDKEALAIVQAVIALARSLGLRLIAEGLETPEQIDTLRSLGCDEGQGYGLGRPQPSEAIIRLLNETPGP